MPEASQGLNVARQAAQDDAVELSGQLKATAAALMKVADETAQGRVVSVLEGGYSLEGLASGTATDQKASHGLARKVAATSSGRSPIASKAF